jgi:Ca2+-binding RTX toxin-like protein
MTGEDPGAFTDQEALYEAAGILLNSISANSGAPNELIDLTGYSAQTLVNVASQDDGQGRACRYALVNLQPFALLQTDSDQPVYDALDDAYNLDQFTEQYLEDRALFLNTLNTFYLTDTSVNGEDLIEFNDEASDQLVMINAADDHVSQRYYFGDGEADDYTGGTDDDHLYGGGGNDTLNGQSGNDYLEGNTGIDSLVGGAGDDALYGDAGNDTLEGGADRDLLVGGVGRDTLRGGAGIDILYGDNRYYDADSDQYVLVNDREIDRSEGGQGDDLYFAGSGDVINDADGLGMVSAIVTI